MADLYAQMSGAADAAEPGEPRVPDAPFSTCAHVISIGSMAVYVTPGCPYGHRIKGVLACTKKECRRCREWVGRDSKSVGGVVE